MLGGLLVDLLVHRDRLRAGHRDRRGVHCGGGGGRSGILLAEIGGVLFGLAVDAAHGWLATSLSRSVMGIEEGGVMSQGGRASC